MCVCELYKHIMYNMTWLRLISNTTVGILDFYYHNILVSSNIFISMLSFSIIKHSYFQICMQNNTCRINTDINRLHIFLFYAITNNHTWEIALKLPLLLEKKCTLYLSFCCAVTTVYIMAHKSYCMCMTAGNNICLQYRGITLPFQLSFSLRKLVSSLIRNQCSKCMTSEGLPFHDKKKWQWLIN